MQKPKVIKDFEKLDEAIQEQIKLTYPNGFFEHLISYMDKDGNENYALPFETDEKYYMVRMTVSKAKQIISDDDDYDDDGNLKDDIQEIYKEKHQDVDYLDIDDVDVDIAEDEEEEED